MTVPFTPGPTVSLAVSTSSASVDMGSQVVTVRVFNSSSGIVFIRFADQPDPVATTSDLPIAPNSVEAFSLRGARYVAAVTASGTGTVYFTDGEGA